MPDSLEVPLFPLGTVLFPTQPLPLRIFEERYKLMISECIETGSGFGVVLIKEGREVGAPAVPFDVGTMAEIVESERFPDGRYNLKTIGAKPFRLIRVTQLNPYMRGEIEPLEYERSATSSLESLMGSVRERFLVHLEVLAEIYGAALPSLDLSTEDPELLSYLVANILAVRMPEKQMLLEEASVTERLKREASMLARENKALQALLYLKQQRKSEPGAPSDLSDRISPN